MRLARLLLLSVLVVTACGGPIDESLYTPIDKMGMPVFRPVPEVEAIELIWLSESTQPDLDVSTLLRSPGRCSKAEDQERCLSLLTAAIEGFVSTDSYERLVPPVAIDTCIMCEVVEAYLFVVTPDSASAIPGEEAIPLFGQIDAPGEAMVVLGEFADARLVDDGFELLTKDWDCDPLGVHLEVWTVETDGDTHFERRWFERHGDNCDDI
ncbi:MAG: hypothetical protein GY698_24835 [Actinomycetia bacterium]|nr:hypothetical protein [Actinomycetes bacterium]